MATEVQFRRGSTTDHASFTGAIGEITVDTDLKTIRVHDGTTAGGHRVLLHSEFVGAGSGTVSSISTGTGLTGGPITDTGTIAIEGTYITKIDTAYSWGDHAQAGYISNINAQAIGSLVDVEIINPQANQVLAFNTNGNKFVNVNQSGGGGTGTFLGLTDTPSQFVSGDAGKLLAVNSSYDAIEFISSTGEANTVTNRGAGEGSIFYTKTGVDLELRTLKAGSNVTITQNSNEITVSAGASAFSAGNGINVDGNNVISVDNTVLRTSGNFTAGGIITFSQAPVFSSGFSTTSTLGVEIPASPNREVLFKGTVADATNDFLDLSNLTTSVSSMSPALRGGVYTASNVPALTLTGEVPSNRDTGSTPVMEFIVRRGSNITHSATYGLEATLATRTSYFDFKNHTTSLFSLGSNGATVESALTVNGITTIPHNLKYKNNFNLLSGLQSGISAATYPGVFATANNAPYFSSTTNSGEWLKLALDSSVPSVFNTLDADTGGPRTPQTAQAELVVSGGTGIDTALTYDSGTGKTTLTITNTGGGGSGGGSQSIWQRINADAGYTIANSTTDILTIAGGNGINTNITGDTLTITNNMFGNVNAIKDITVSGQNTVSVSGLDQAVEFEAGSNMTITTSGSKVIFASTGSSGGSTNSFSTISTSGQSDIVASSGTDTLTLVAGSGIGLATNSSTDTLTITNTANAAYAFTNVNITGSNNITAGSASDTITFEGGTNVTLASNSSTKTVTINATASSQNVFTTFEVPSGTNPEANGSSDTLIFSAGSGITITGDANTDTITIAASGGGSSWDPRTLAVTMLDVRSPGSSAYTMFYPDTTQLGGNNPTVYVMSGTTICFDLTNVGNSHPFILKNVNSNTSGTTNRLTSGVVHWDGNSTYTNNPSVGHTSGYLFLTPPIGTANQTAWGYQCTSHSAMLGTISIKAIESI